MPNIYVGTIGWSYSFWKPSFYPVKLPSTRFLEYYASQFNTVEVDNTFYRIPNVQYLQKWKEQTPDNFKFSLKFSQIITHIRMLKDVQRETSLFLDRVKVLGEKLGPMLLQFPPTFGEKQFPVLSDYLAGLPEDLRFVVEIRNKGLLREDLFSLLRRFNVALAWVDSPNMPLVSEVTSDFLYVRLEGDRKTVVGTLGKMEVDRSHDIGVWAERIRQYTEKQLKVFVYFGKYFSGNPPMDVVELRKKLL